MSHEHDPKKPSFGIFDPQAHIDIAARNMPHWFQPGVAVFITFRTADSMPRHVVERWLEEQKQWLIRNGFSVSAVSSSEGICSLPSNAQKEFRRLRHQLWHQSLDDCHGACVLRRHELAKIVAKSLYHFNGDRYDLDSFVVMPNHVHLLVQFRNSISLAKQTESWLRFTGRQINQQLGRKGAFWQSEPFDHLVRSSEQFQYLQRYIAENPIKARLSKGEYLYWHA